ncbi:MAG: hypothetical protein RL616_1065 [Verrucomicrobiota bacterium]
MEIFGSSDRIVIVDFKDHFPNPADKFHVDAASGWIGLGDLQSARDELKLISPEIQNHPAVLMVQSELLFAEENWETLLPLTEKLLLQFPKLDFLWINRSYALHELKRTQEAFNALLPATKKFPKRFELSHMKDGNKRGTSDKKHTSCIIGKGDVDFKGILENKKLAGLKMLIVEIEDYVVSPLADSKVCLENFKKLV